MEQKIREYAGGDNGSVNGAQRVLEWEEGLPNTDKIAPLSQTLIPLELASAFRILTAPCRTIMDVDLASNATLSNIRDVQSEACKTFESNEDQSPDQDARMIERDASRKVIGKADFAEEVANSSRIDDSIEDASARTLKRPRLTWTPQLHKRFVDVVSHLGLKTAVPKNIMQLMNVDGLTRENVASHLQKYRLYLKRTQVSSMTEELLVPFPALQSRRDSTACADAYRNGHFPADHFPMTFVPSPMMPVMFFGMGAHTSLPAVNPGTAGSGGLETQLRD